MLALSQKTFYSNLTRSKNQFFTNSLSVGNDEYKAS
jgi:hypothetical protein